MFIITTRKRLIKLLKIAREESKQEGVAIGYRLGEIAGGAEERNKGCILSVHPSTEGQKQVEKWLKEIGLA